MRCRKPAPFQVSFPARSPRRWRCVYSRWWPRGGLGRRIRERHACTRPRPRTRIASHCPVRTCTPDWDRQLSGPGACICPCKMLRRFSPSQPQWRPRRPCAVPLCLCHRVSRVTSITLGVHGTPEHRSCSCRRRTVTAAGKSKETFMARGWTWSHTLWLAPTKHASRLRTVRRRECPITKFRFFFAESAVSLHYCSRCVVPYLSSLSATPFLGPWLGRPLSWISVWTLYHLPHAGASDDLVPIPCINSLYNK